MLYIFFNHKIKYVFILYLLIIINALRFLTNYKKNVNKLF